MSSPISVSILKSIESCTFKTASLGKKLFVNSTETGLAIHDLEAGTSSSLPVQPGTLAVVNPSNRILALRTEKEIQVFDLQNKIKLLNVTWPEDVEEEDRVVRFWKWVTDSALAIITSTRVYEVSLHGNGQLTLVFDLAVQLQAEPGSVGAITDITYHPGQEEGFYVVIGFSNMERKSQLYSTSRKVSQVIDGIISFASVPQETGDGTVIAILKKGTTSGQYDFMAVSLPGVLPMVRKATSIQYEQFDIMLMALPFARYGMLGFLFKSGTIVLFDCVSGSLIYKGEDLKSHLMFMGVPLDEGNGALVVSKDNILNIHIEDAALMEYMAGKELEGALRERIAPLPPSSTESPYATSEPATRHTLTKPNRSKEVEELITRALQIVSSSPAEVNNSGVVTQRLYEILGLLNASKPSTPTLCAQEGEFDF